MATTRIWPVRDNLARVVDYAENHLKTANPDVYTERELQELRQVLDYAENSEKTAMQFLVTSVNCVDKCAYQQMSATKQRFGKTGGNLAYHAYQSFAPGEVTPKECHDIGVQLAKNIWGDRYEVLVTTHINTRCVHNHLVVNSVSFVDGKKLNNNYAMYFKHLRAESDRLCLEHRLSVIENPGKTSGSRWMQQAEKRGELTPYNIIRSDIDNVIKQSMTMSGFYNKLRDMGYIVNDDPNRKYATIRFPNAKHNTRFKTLGEQYTPSVIAERILANKIPVVPQRMQVTTRHYQLRGSFKSVKKITDVQAVFIILGYLLGIYPTKRVDPTRPPLSPELRAAQRQCRKFSDQITLICKHRIKTTADLKTFITERNAELGDQKRLRGKVYNRMKSAKTPEVLEKLKSKRDELTGGIQTIRHELKLSEDVLKQSAEVERLIRTEMKLRSERYDNSKDNNKNKNRNYEKTKGLSR